jgi:hypothetical protein
LEAKRKPEVPSLESGNFNDEDYEAALGNVNNSEDTSIGDDPTKKAEDETIRKIKSYGIVNVSGSDLSGRPVIILAACNIPGKQEIEREKKFFKSQQDFFDLLFKYDKNVPSNR